jgi:hypothetical protein
MVARFRTPFLQHDSKKPGWVSKDFAALADLSRMLLPCACRANRHASMSCGYRDIVRVYMTCPLNTQAPGQLSWMESLARHTQGCTFVPRPTVKAASGVYWVVLTMLLFDDVFLCVCVHPGAAVRSYVQIGGPQCRPRLYDQSQLFGVCMTLFDSTSCSSM